MSAMSVWTHLSPIKKIPTKKIIHGAYFEVETKGIYAWSRTVERLGSVVRVLRLS